MVIFKNLRFTYPATKIVETDIWGSTAVVVSNINSIFSVTKAMKLENKYKEEDGFRVILKKLFNFQDFDEESFFKGNLLYTKGSKNSLEVIGYKKNSYVALKRTKKNGFENIYDVIKYKRGKKKTLLAVTRLVTVNDKNRLPKFTLRTTVQASLIGIKKKMKENL